MLTISSRSFSKGSDFEQVYDSPIVLQSRGADEESVTRHSKKRRERIFSDEEGKLAEDGRKRRSRGSSDDGGTIGWDGFINKDLRVGGPILCPLPSHALFQRLCSPASPVLGLVSGIISDHGIVYQELSVCQQTNKFRPQDGSTVTISIISKRAQKDEQWGRAARAARFYLNSVGLTQVAVEIADSQAFVPNQSPQSSQAPKFTINGPLCEIPLSTRLIWLTLKWLVVIGLAKVIIQKPSQSL
jgi:hypothetical protein